MNLINLRLSIAFILALILTILPMPEWTAGIRPAWVLMLVLYLQFYRVDYFHVVILFILGLILDALLSTVIGEHAFALSIVTWIANNKARRFNFFSIGQQMGLIGFFCLLYYLIITLIDAFLGFYTGFISVIMNTIISLLLWPWLRLIVEDSLRIKAF